MILSFIIIIHLQTSSSHFQVINLFSKTLLIGFVQLDNLSQWKWYMILRFLEGHIYSAKPELAYLGLLKILLSNLQNQKSLNCIFVQQDRLMISLLVRITCKGKLNFKMLNFISQKTQDSSFHFCDRSMGSKKTVNSISSTVFSENSLIFSGIVCRGYSQKYFF